VLIAPKSVHRAPTVPAGASRRRNHVWMRHTSAAVDERQRASFSIPRWIRGARTWSRHTPETRDRQDRTMTLSKTLLTAATATAALAAAGVAFAAQSPVVTAQKVLGVKTAPSTIPGTGVKKGATLPKGARIVYRDVTLSGSQEPKFVITAPKGKTIRG